MEQKQKRGLLLGLTALLALGAFFLRQAQLRTAYDESGMIRPGAGLGIFTWYTIGAVLLLAALAFFLAKRQDYGAIASRSPLTAIVICLAAFGTVIGSIMQYLSPEKSVDTILALLSLFSGVCWLMMALGGLQGKRLHPLLYFLPVIAYGARLALDFRSLSSDPVILDYCYDLLALIFTMCALLELGAFAFDRGRRRLAVFFCLGSVFFNAAALADATPRNLALTGGALVYLLSYSWLLLRPVAVRKAAKDANP